ITGTLTLRTPLHVGSGQGGELTDAPVVKYLDKRPYVPGSSFKGVLRSTVERLAEALGYTTCWLDPDCTFCLSTDKNQGGLQEQYQGLQERRVSENKLVRFLTEHLCDTCKTFGSPFAASKVLIEDLRSAGSNQCPNPLDIRDGVGIDRDTGTARDKIKFDFETVDIQHRFNLRLTVENAGIVADDRSTVLALVALGLNEFMKGTRLGGMTSRGLGWCQLESVQARLLNFQNSTPQQRLDLLLTRDINQLPFETGEQFITRWLKCNQCKEG
ncbi:MAG TPA: CRISPR-associated RAMP protein, partial [Candidatus Fraserbacteria bacterium]|nr:CRISPR-associated RAMP protein [Candidatus Fraserbacteria bacterium]